VSQLDAVVKGDAPLPEISVQHLSPVEYAVGRILADNLIDDGATLQLGLFAIKLCNQSQSMRRVNTVYGSGSSSSLQYLFIDMWLQCVKLSDKTLLC